VGVVFSTPFLMHGWLLYPEMAAASIVAWSLWWAWRPAPDRLATWARRGCVVSALPWLHVKFAVLLACLTLALGIRLRTRRSGLEQPTAPVAAATATPFRRTACSGRAEEPRRTSRSSAVVQRRCGSSWRRARLVGGRE
jgi:hypothetical protein